jgi:hypothetical protein
MSSKKPAKENNRKKLSASAEILAMENQSYEY